MFALSWQVVRHLDDIPETAGFQRFNFLGESTIVIRGRDRSPRTFSNVCLHRGARPLDGRDGKCGRISVPTTAGVMPTVV